MSETEEYYILSLEWLIKNSKDKRLKKEYLKELKEILEEINGKRKNKNK